MCLPFPRLSTSRWPSYLLRIFEKSKFLGTFISSTLCCKSCCRSMWRSWRVVSGGEHIVMPKAWAHYKCLTMYHTAKVCLIMVCNCAWEEYKRLAVFCVFPRNYELYLYEPSSKLVLLFRVCLQFFPCYQVKYLGKFP